MPTHFRQPQSLALAVLCAFSAAGCANLPDTGAILQRHTAQAARFENARGPLSVQKSAAILAELKRRSGDIDILEKQIALEQAINDSPLTLGNKATLLQDGPATYSAMFTAIGQAQDHINLESYIIEDDAVGREFSELLLAQQRRGVQVNLIYDSVGGFNTPRLFFDRLTQAGVAVLEFNPVNPLASRGPWLLNNRDHRKLLIVDGRTAFIGIGPQKPESTAVHGAIPTCRLKARWWPNSRNFSCRPGTSKTASPWLRKTTFHHYSRLARTWSAPLAAHRTTPTA